MTKLLQHQGITKSILSDDLDEMFDCLIEANDIILERIVSFIFVEFSK